MGARIDKTNAVSELDPYMMIWRGLRPKCAKRIDIARDSRTKQFAHYTSASAALNMLRTGEIWLRNARTMNDLSEVNYAFDGLSCLMSEPAGQRLLDAASRVAPGLGQRVFLERLNSAQVGLRHYSYVASICEHSSENGRLSMWRAYGGDSAVAFVMKSKKLLRVGHLPHLYTRPIDYFDYRKFENAVGDATKFIESNVQLLQSITKKHAENMLFSWIAEQLVCTKHPGFVEEKEWRILPMPVVEGATGLEYQIQDVRGTKQVVQVARLFPSSEVTAQAPGLVHKIIVGPGPSQREVMDAVDFAVKGKIKVRASYIPHR